MNKKSVFIGMILAVVCVFTLTACGITQKGSSESEEQSSTSETLVEQLYSEAVTLGFEGTLEDFIASLSGASAYEIAVRNGFQGTEEEWLVSLKGEKGDKGDDGEAAVAEAIKGDSAYEIAVKNGFEGTEEEWLLSLKGADGEDGKDGKDGKDGTNGRDGQDAVLTVYDVYETAVENGFGGTLEEFLEVYLTLTAETDAIQASNLLSSVSVICSFPVQQYEWSPRYGYTLKTVTGTSAGSGVIYSLNREAGEAYIITNYHVVYYSESVTGISNNVCVYLYGSEIVGSEFYSEEYFGSSALTEKGLGFNATYVGGSMYYDIAVLRVTDERLKTADIAAVNFADSNEIAVGQTAYAVGNAEGDGISVTKGVVSVDSESITMTASDGRTNTTFRVIRIDTAVNSGNSGGGLFDVDGKLIGIVNAKTVKIGVENISYALPSNVVRNIVENILYYADTENKTSDVRKCVLGITSSTQQSSAVLGEDGRVHIVETVSVSSVAEGSLADGKLEVGDKLLSVRIERTTGEVENYEIDRSFVLADLMLTMRVGDSLTVAYEREGAEGTATFAMTEECISEIG